MTEHYNLGLVDIKFKKKWVDGTDILEYNKRHTETRTGEIFIAILKTVGRVNPAIGVPYMQY